MTVTGLRKVGGVEIRFEISKLMVIFKMTISLPVKNHLIK